MYADTLAAEAAEGEDSGASDLDIESEIKKEIEEIRRPKVEPLFKNIKLQGQCCKHADVMFQLWWKLTIGQ